MSNKFLIIDSDILPDVFLKVIKVKELIRTGRVKDISEGTRKVGISRSTYYKYKDSVFDMSEGVAGHKITLGFMILHKAGTLSKIIDKIAEEHGNILTINQDIPINNVASVSVTFDASKLLIDIKELVKDIENMENIVSVRLIAVE
ncbi:ACT domain-containing protein [Clostridium sp. cel8]|jgi:chorismate mutase|uniref:ACT domain-containing protein n=1 Tax=unclassified Clostridium TaxID=2614128 RepID=UPI0015F537A1|nr:ACT domain-containing protein [Clostridium sp. cel8]MBA5849937.1 ACT domain-containing protein [Clostridium sp. cel8]